jgi:outer membrane protein assembly factor BamB
MKKLHITIGFLLVLVLAQAQQVQFRGPQRDGKFPDTGLLKTWPEAGPELLLKVEGIGKGFSSVVANDKNIFATGMIDTLDYLSCINPDGKIKWKVPYGRSWTKSFPDTRSTPTIDGNRIYVTSGTGQLVCINATDGTIFWKINVDKDYEAEWHNWGVSESPLIVDDKVICSPSGAKTSLVAFDKITGKMIWQSVPIGGKRAYASPTIYQYNKFRFILSITTRYVFALEPSTGKIAWTFRYQDDNKGKDKDLIWTNIPTFKGRDIYLSMGYNYPSLMLQMNEEGNSVSEKWSNSVLDNHHGGIIEKDGFVYGSNWENNSKGKWVCLNWETGELKYETSWFTKGPMVYADGLLYIMEEKSGTVAIVAANPDKFEIISSFKLVGGAGPFWSHPFITNGKLYLRHGDVLFVYNIKG